METKKCSSCKQEQLIDQFGASKVSKDGLRPECKPCRKAYSVRKRIEAGGKPRRDKSKDPEGHKFCYKCSTLKEVEDFSKSATQCKDCSQAAGFAYRPDAKRKHIPLVLKDKKECYDCRQVLPISEYSPSERGRLGLSAYCKGCVNKKPRDLEKGRLQSQKWRVENHEYWKSLHRLHQYKRRYKQEITSDGTVTPAFCRELYNRELCFYCSKETAKELRTIEHVVPLSRGGAHSASNIEMACLSCNCSKAGKIPEEFLTYNQRHDAM